MGVEARRQHHLRQLNAIETIGLLTLFAIEMRMLVVVVLMTMTMTELISRSIAAALDDMHQMILSEEGQCTEDVRLVDRRNTALQFRQRLWQHRGGQRLQYNDAVGCRLDAMFLKQFDTGYLVHSFSSFLQK